MRHIPEEKKKMHEEIELLIGTQQEHFEIRHKLLMFMSLGLGMKLHRSFTSDPTVEELIEYIEDYLKHSLGVEVKKYTKEDEEEMYDMWEIEEAIEGTY